MEEPLKIVFDNLDHSPAIESMIWEKCEKLERLYQYMTIAQVIVSLEHSPVTYN